MYGELFGMPEFALELRGDIINRITVNRGAPCGATWEAALRLAGLPAAIAGARIGLEIQFFCSASPSKWNILHGKSPVHFAGQVHQAALERALKRACSSAGVVPREK